MLPRFPTFGNEPFPLLELAEGFDPPTSRLQGGRSARLSYASISINAGGDFHPAGQPTIRNQLPRTPKLTTVLMPPDHARLLELCSVPAPAWDSFATAPPRTTPKHRVPYSPVTSIPPPHLYRKWELLWIHRFASPPITRREDLYRHRPLHSPVFSFLVFHLA